MQDTTDQNDSASALIQQAVRERGWTRARLAQAIECSRMHLWRLETGRSGATPETLQRIRAAATQPPDAELRDMLDKVFRLEAPERLFVLQMLHAMLRYLDGRRGGGGR